VFGATTVSGWVDKTLQTRPKGATHWSTRSLAREVGVSKNTIHRVWRDHQLKPHLTKTFKLSRDPHFLEKLCSCASDGDCIKRESSRATAAGTNAIL
jgi:hypothetical protein